MLQQTQVAIVIGFYERWMARFPDLATLAAADTADVLRAWEGLGYYSRARNLQKAARVVMTAHDGRLPRSARELRELPGIGPYSAGAIASIAFGADEPAVDGNIIRVLTRAFGLGGDPQRAPLAKQLWALARSLIPPGEARELNQALMELGATCCTPRAPRCVACPVSRFCVALAQDRVLAYPETARRPQLTDVQRAAALIRKRGRVLVVQAPESAPRWAGMWQFPDVELPGPASARAADGGPANEHVSRPAKAALCQHVKEALGLDVHVGEQLSSLRHHVTRFRISIDVYACATDRGRARAIQYAAARWCSPVELAALAMPAAHRKIARSLS